MCFNNFPWHLLTFNKYIKAETHQILIDHYNLIEMSTN